MSDVNMNETTSGGVETLLPKASVAVYARDADTASAAAGVADDWRFARVDVDMHEGDVETAIKAYASAASPDLLIVQTDVIDDAFTARLEALAALCAEGTAAIVVGPDNDVNLYRRLIDMGVSDYLVRPLRSETLTQVLAKTLVQRLGIDHSNLIAVIGAKGGVGTTVLTEAMAWASADILGHKTALLDGSGGWSTFSVGMGFEPTTTLAEAAKAAAAKDEDALARMLFAAGERLSVLASGGDSMLERPITPDQLEDLLDMLLAKFPVVFTDLSESSAGIRNAVLRKAQRVIVVATPGLPGMRLARSLLQEVKTIRGDDDSAVDVMINMQGIAPSHEVAAKDFEQALGCVPAAQVPFAPKTFIPAESEGKRLSDSKEGAALVLGQLVPILEKTLARVQADALPIENGGLSGWVKKLTA